MPACNRLAYRGATAPIGTFLSVGLWNEQTSYHRNRRDRRGGTRRAQSAAVGILADMAIRMAWFSGASRNRDAGQLQLVLIAVGIVGWIIAALIGPLVSAAVSRQREYLADATGAHTTRYPEGLASALQKLGQYGRPLRRASSSMAHMYINDPVKPGLTERLFSTHPPIPERIARLRAIGSKF